MFYILNNSKSGMVAQQQKLDIISNNMVNVNTHGYKKLDSSFSSLFYKNLNVNGIPTSKNNNAYIGNGVKNTGAVRNQTQGSLQATGKNTDIAIDGNGFLKIIDANGEVAYTRSGVLNVDIFGRITDNDGNLVEVIYNEGINPASTGLTNSNIVIDKMGFVSTSDGKDIGKINLYEALGNGGLISKGDNKFVPVDETVTMFEIGGSDIYQGHLEMSNVDVASEMSDMILAQRAYQLASKGVSTADEMWSMINNIR